MNKNVIWILVFFLSAQAAGLFAASSKIDPSKPGGPARDETLGAPPPTSDPRDLGTARQPPPQGGERKASPREATQRFTGSIVSLTSIEMVVAQTDRKENKTVKFVLRPQTLKQGELKMGARVTVEYQIENAKNIARQVQVHGGTAPRRVTPTPRASR
jgi:hypothetical protein